MRPHLTKKLTAFLSFSVVSLAFSGCFNSFLAGQADVLTESTPAAKAPVNDVLSEEPAAVKTTSESENDLATVIDASFSGEPGAYQITATIASFDLGCEQYADWWEVLDSDGQLLYRRILAHSHVEEQPFTRSGGPVAIDPGQIITIRAHMNPGGYGGQALQGSVNAGLEPAYLSAEFATELAEQEPLPDGCAF